MEPEGRYGAAFENRRDRRYKFSPAKGGKRGAMFRLFSTLVKIAIASLITGVILTKLNLSADQILREVGLTPDSVMEWLQQGAAWAVPNIVLGSMVIVPVWVVVYLFRPPRD
jgi:hypothetical protein